MRRTPTWGDFMSYRKSHKAALVLAFAGVLAGASMASAQPRWEITPFAGYYIASDLYNAYSSTGAGSGTVELTNSFMWGGRLTASVPGGGLEFAYTRSGSDIKTHNTFVGVPSGSKLGHLNIDSYDINFIGYQPSPNPNVSPFAEVGFGWSATHPEIDSQFHIAAQPDGNTLFNFNFGIGVRAQVNPKIATRIEGRWRVTDTNLTTSSGVWCDPFGYCYSYATDWYNSGELLGGISYAFK